MTQSRSPSVTGLLLLLLASLSAGLSNAFAQTAGPDPDTVEKLRTSMNYVAGLKQFSLNTRSTIEVVLDSGQKIQFADAEQVTVQRPNKLLAVRDGELVDQEFYYDGETLTLSNPDDGFYATVEAPETLESMLDYARESLDIIAPAGDFLYQNAFDILMENVSTGFTVGSSSVDGTPCDHLAFSGEGTDWQIWIQQGDQPLPRKLVITSRDVTSAPQFTVEITDWNLAPTISDDQFHFTPPDNAKAIEFATVDGSGQ